MTISDPLSSSSKAGNCYFSGCLGESPKIYVLKQEESLFRRILNIICRYLPFLRSFADWICPAFQNVKKDLVRSSIMGSQDVNDMTQVYSGEMKGSWLVIGLNPDGSEQFFSHDDSWANGYKNTKTFIQKHTNWKYYLFLTEKTKGEISMWGRPLLSIIDKIQQFYVNKFSEVFYLHDLQLDRVELEYQPRKCELIVKGICEGYKKGHTEKTITSVYFRHKI